MWKHRDRDFMARQAYCLPGRLAPLLPSATAWHYEHAMCEFNARREPCRIASFIVGLQHMGGIRYVPFEQSILASCALCAVFRKVGPCLAESNDKHLTGCIELRRDTDGIKTTFVIDAEHGCIAHSILLDRLRSIEPGEIVYLKEDGR
jgi:hypothetical protein